MSGIQTLRTDALSETPSTPGIKRNLAFNGEGYLVVRARSDPGVVSGWHHHGDYEVYGYVASGSVLFESDPENVNPVSLDRGDFFHVPAHTIHREINPSSETQNEVILFLLGTGPLVINIDDT
jgi:quercetin dioxygenase-like cupin family protein